MQDVSQNIKVTRINGSESRGGWQCDFSSLSPRSQPDILEDISYGETMSTDIFRRWQNVVVNWRGAFGGPPGILRVGFNGWTMPQRFEFDRAGSLSQFVAQTSDGFLRRGWIQGINFAEQDPRESYHRFDSTGAGLSVPCDADPMTLGKMVRHILGYHDECDDIGPNWVAHTNMVFHPTQNPHGWISLDNVSYEPFDDPGNIDGSAVTAQYDVRETDNLWSRLREIARSEFFVIVFDKTDTLWYRPHPMYLATLPDPVMTFDENFIITPPVVEVREVDAVRQVVMHALTDEEDPLRFGDGSPVRFPFQPIGTPGKKVEIGRLRCNDVSQLFLWALRHFSFLNRPYTVRWTAPGLCGLLFEILDRIQITYTGTSANGVHIDWAEEKFWIHDIDVIPDDGFGGRTIFTLEAENIAIDV